MKMPCGHIGTEINNKAETVYPNRERQRRQQHQQSGKCAYTFQRLPAIRFFCINDQSLPNFCRIMCRQRRAQVVPSRNRSPLIKTSMKAIHRKALGLAFDGKETISGYKALEEELTTAYELAGTKFHHNKIVEIIKFLTNKRMVVQESPWHLSVHAGLPLLTLHLTLF